MVPCSCMKRTLTLLGMSACVLLALNSCKSTVDEDEFESAMPMATDSIADGDMPPWLIDDVDDGWGGQVPAGATTHDQYPIPEPGESVADVYGSSSGASQNQPAVAVQQGATVHDSMPVEQSAVAITTPEAPSRTIGIEPRPTPTVVKPTTKPEKIVKNTTTKTNKNTTKKPSKKEQAKVRGKRYTEPTLLTYKVRKGDNLSDIAKRSRTTVAQIKKDSGLKSDTIYPGQVIKVRYIPKNYKPSKDAKKQQQVRTHVVAKGQTISGIAKRYGVPYTEILKANGMSLKDASRIRPGKRLTIPAAGTKKK